MSRVRRPPPPPLNLTPPSTASEKTAQPQTVAPAESTTVPTPAATAKKICNHMLAGRFTLIPEEHNRVYCFQCDQHWSPDHD